MDEKVNLSTACLAYMGDAVFELHVRKMLLAKGNRPIDAINRMARKYVSAKAQSGMYHALEHHLSEAEQNVMKRGRNLHSNSKAKNAGTIEYRHATGLETLFGYLFVNQRHERIDEIFKICIEIGENCEKQK